MLAEADAEIAELAAAVPAAARACRAILWSREDADDCVGAALEQALRARQTTTLECPRAWLISVAKRRALDLAKRRAREERRAATQVAAETMFFADPTSSVDDEHEADWLWRQAQALPPTTVRVLASIRGGATVAEAASDLGITKRAAESHVLRARQRLMSAWRCTLSVGGGFPLAMRRILGSVAAPATAVAAVAGAALLVLPTAQHPASPGSATRAPGSVAVAVREPVAAHPLTPRLRADVVNASPHGHIRAVPATGSGRAPRRRAVHAAVGTPAGPVTVQEKDRGGPDGVVTGTAKCLSELEVSARRVGC
jgi:RNA polymerase sigma factor (sigma-70 family)